jgi:hypothetical protein
MAEGSRIPFDTRQERVIAELARWMNLLGRFQIIAATFVFILLLAAVALVTAAEVLEPAAGAAGEQPIFTIGEVSRTAIAAVVAVVVGFTLVFWRGGMVLIGAAEDFELMSGEKDQQHLDAGLRKLRTYFVMESLLMIGVVALVYAATLWQGSIT